MINIICMHYGRKDMPTMVKNICIWLDDSRVPPKGYIWFKNAAPLISFIKSYDKTSYKIDTISIANELGFAKLEGIDVLKEIEKLEYNDPNFVMPLKIDVHRALPEAERYMAYVVRALFNHYNLRTAQHA